MRLRPSVLPQLGILRVILPLSDQETHHLILPHGPVTRTVEFLAFAVIIGWNLETGLARISQPRSSRFEKLGDVQAERLIPAALRVLTRYDLPVFPSLLICIPLPA